MFFALLVRFERDQHNLVFVAPQGVRVEVFRTPSGTAFLRITRTLSYTMFS
jgi:hypothetical protein